MPDETYNNSHLTDTQLKELFDPIKPQFVIDEAWLMQQRAQLEGALQVAAKGSWLSRFKESASLWWEELPYLFAGARPVLAWGSAMMLGVIVGRFVLTGGAVSTPAGMPATFADRDAVENVDLAEMIRSGQIKDIDVGIGSDPENPITLSLTTGREMQMTGSVERDDILAGLEYVLVRDPNPGQRLQSARILGGVSNLDSKESTMMALVSALLTDENPGVRLSIVRSIQGIQSPMVKDALIKTTLEDTNEGVRLASVEALGQFLSDLSVRSALLLASRMDEAEAVRYQAYQLLSEARALAADEGLDVSP